MSCQGFLLFLEPIFSNFSVFNINAVALFSMTKKLVTHYIITRKPQRPLLFFSPINLPPEITHHTFPCLNSPI